MTRQIIESNKATKLLAYIRNAKKVVITCHISPDGDALGSTLALRHVLESLGKKACVITPDLMPRTLSFLPEADTVIDGNRYADRSRMLFGNADLVFCLDFNARSRIDRLQSSLSCSKAPVVMIDHHLEPENFADLTISRPELSSTCILLYYILEEIGLYDHIDATAATLILAGMMTDTGNFSYNASDPDIYEVVSQLMRKGADKQLLYKRLFNTSTESSLRINGYALSEKMEIFADYHAALITLSREELNRFHYCKGDTEALVNRPLAIPGIIYSCFMREEDNYIKVSMRSVGNFPVDRLCSEYFGGGGHLNAAGGEFTGTLIECADLFRALLARNMELYIDKTID